MVGRRKRLFPVGYVGEQKENTAFNCRKIKKPTDEARLTTQTGASRRRFIFVRSHAKMLQKSYKNVTRTRHHRPPRRQLTMATLENSTHPSIPQNTRSDK